MKLGDAPLLTLSALGIGAYLLNFLYLAVIIRRRIAGLGRKIYLICLPALAVSMAMMLCINEVCRCVIGGREPSVFTDSAANVSALLCLAVIVLLTALWGVLWLRQEQDIMSSLTPQSLEDGLNSLPDGAAFISTGGIPLMVNSTMQRICRQALGRPLFDLRTLENSLQRNELTEGCTSEVRGKGYYLHLKDGTVWDIKKTLLNVDRRKVWELLAYDITERYQKSRELEERNAHLTEVNQSIRAYTRELNAIIREEEVLAAKIRIHDDVGRALLALKSYLIRGGDRAALMELWQFTAQVLKGENDPDGSADAIGALKEAADAVGVKLTLNGEIPDDLRKVLTIAIHECLTNTVKHADGTELSVDVTDKDDVVTAVFTNNGRPPEGEISERGGLKSLRTAVEQVRGEMEMAADPQFRLTIRVDRKEQ
ncbi:ATP-binding protein [Ruminococcus sp.]|uniref:ATP-binding protein n=1 Tax=Ruminococcus sp. TaxID=41978 RepID=UPI0025FFC1EE|nr:ATP-binding protein [Ruminococcus sp.]MBQ8965534.1 ATP-binding protein [Ruminococcus sp.]